MAPELAKRRTYICDGLCERLDPFYDLPKVGILHIRPDLLSLAPLSGIHCVAGVAWKFRIGHSQL